MQNLYKECILNGFEHPQYKYLLIIQMSRSVAWRRTCNDLVNWRQVEALNATMYILRETGPTGFLLQEEGEPKPVKVSRNYIVLGDDVSPESGDCQKKYS